MSRRMGNLAKSLGLIIVAQAVCLALGLWIHDRFVVSTAHWTGDQRTWEQLVDASRDAVASLPPLRLNDLTAGTAEFDAAESLLDGFELPEGSTALLVDTEWRIVLMRHSTGAKTNRLWSPGKAVSWVGPADFSGSPWQPNQGTLKAPDGPHQALAYRLGDGQGYVLFSHTKATGTLSAAALLQVFPLVGVISFVWIFALQSIVVCTILIRIHNERSREKIQLSEKALRRTQDLIRTRDAVIFGLAKLAESRDPETGHHLERISLYSTRLTSAAHRSQKYRDMITPSFIQLIGISSALHDIGKVGIKDAVLLKPGRLNEEERLHIQTHATIGGECLRQIEKRLGTSNFLQMAREIAFFHHERWDGTGYPHGVKGKQIPLAARIVAIADVYDAMSVRRIYKQPIAHDECVAYIRQQAGKHFDPNLVEVFLQIKSQFREIARVYAAPPSGEEKPILDLIGQHDHLGEVAAVNAGTGEPISPSTEAV